MFVFLLSTFQACSQERPAQYPNFVGDIAYDPELDDVGFKVCNPSYVAQYYNFGQGVQFSGEKSRIIKHFGKYYQPSRFVGETGYITIRFIVNCEGSAGRFRVQEMDMDLVPKKFGKGLANELLKITSNMQGWGIASHETQVFDYYQYLTFKIENGTLTEILP
jgi:hypothetical protein